MHVDTTLSELHSDVSLFTVTHMPCRPVCTESSQVTTNLPHVSAGGGGDWLFSKGHLMFHLLYRHYTVCCSPMLHQSHYRGTQRSGRARLTLQYTQGVSVTLNDKWVSAETERWLQTHDCLLRLPSTHTRQSHTLQQVGLT